MVLLITGSGCGRCISFLVTMKQVCNTSILKQASLENRLGEELAFDDMKFLTEHLSFPSDECCGPPNGRH